ncbi:hypothetical protein, partial [Escherichia coli]
VFHTIVSIKNDGHYFCRAGGNRPDGLNEPVTLISMQIKSIKVFFTMIFLLTLLFKTFDQLVLVRT